jgi:hypothetical protein
MDYDTSFKHQLVSGFTEKKLAPTSMKMYLRNLEKLNDDLPLKNLNFLKDIPKIEQRLEKYKPNTKTINYGTSETENFEDTPR